LDVKKAQTSCILVSGGWEFMSPSGEKPPLQQLAILTKAFDLMKYDVALLAQQEEELFDSTVLDTTRKSALKAPVSTMTMSNGMRIVFLRLPPLPPGQDQPSQKIIDSITGLIKTERTQAKLIVALSDWGWIGEREYLAASPELVPDLLMGSGLGSGVNGRVEADGRCIWVRPYDKGRTINEIQIFSWPRQNELNKWTQTEHFRSISIGLNDQYKDNPAVDEVLR